MVISVPIQLIVALVLAYWLYKPTRFNKMCRSVFYVPVLCSFTAIGILFNLILNSTVGYIPYLISLVYGEPIALLSEVKFAMPIIIFISVWKAFGKTLIILVAGINDIPSTYFEASEIDGATKTQQFFHITLPNLLPTINFTLLTTIIGGFSGFRRCLRYHGEAALFTKRRRWCSTYITEAFRRLMIWDTLQPCVLNYSLSSQLLY